MLYYERAAENLRLIPRIRENTLIGKLSCPKTGLTGKARKTKTENFLLLKSTQRCYTSLALHTMFIAFKTECEITWVMTGDNIVGSQSIMGGSFFPPWPRCKHLTRFRFSGLLFCTVFCLRCFTSSVCFTGSYTEVKPHYHCTSFNTVAKRI